MKKIIAIAFILLVGLFVLEGCAPTTSETPEDQQPTTQPEQQDQQQAETKEIPQPPALPEVTK